MRARDAITLVELMVVLAILGLLLGLLLPAVQMTRERARETVCKNNLHQISLAVCQFTETHKKLPARSPAGLIGGWMVEVLPFIEQQALGRTVPLGVPLSAAPEQLFRAPAIFQCPRRSVLTPDAPDAIGRAHYVLVPLSRREAFTLYDSPIALDAPWLSGPETDRSVVTTSPGPHDGGYFYSSGFEQGVHFTRADQPR